MEIFLVAVILLIILAISDLIVGVSNDAVNFLNSSIGSKVAPKYVIMIIASLGMLAGVTFSSGMMEVARKGIFHPKFFLMPEIMVIFLAVMITDILLLDLYNTFGLPTSTTVSIVFELLGAAVAVSLIKINLTGENIGDLAKYINSSKALLIISGILLSVIIAFIFGALVQFFTRILFTFDYKPRLKRYGALWGGVALAMISYFILIKGAKGASFLTPEMYKFIKTHAMLILGITFTISVIILQLLISFTKVNILKPIVLIGTFALAMAFAANDLVNFIGVPLAGLTSYQFALQSDNPLTMTMEALQAKVPANTLLLLGAGIIMVVTLWFSRKAKTVTETEVNLGRQEEGFERFGSSMMSRTIVRMVSMFFDLFKKLIPDLIIDKISDRLDIKHYKPSEDAHKGAESSFDLLRASVNLMVASAVVSYATSMKLPLSTTYVTFMVAMGTSLSDKAWGRESATYRVAGVLTVIGGWFFTAFMAFTVSSLIASAIYYFRAPAVIIIIGLALYIIVHNHRLHRKRDDESKEIEVFNIKKVTDAKYAIDTTFNHTGMFLIKINETLDNCYDALFKEDRQQLKIAKAESKKLQNWANIIIANIYKTLRLLHQDDVKGTQKYAQTIRSLQEIAESNRDSVFRAFDHVDNNHKGLLKEQVQELKQIRKSVKELLKDISSTLLKHKDLNLKSTDKRISDLKKFIDKFDCNQIVRIQDDSSKTRLSILFYGLMGDAEKISNHTFQLIKIFNESLKSKNGKKNK